MADVPNLTAAIQVALRALPGTGPRRDVRRLAGRRALPLAVLAAGASLALAPADADAARYIARPADGGRIELEVERGRLRRVEATVPARCENNHGGSWTTKLTIALTGRLPLRSGGFGIQGRAANEVRYQLDGRRRNGAVSGRLRLTFLDLDFVGVDDSYLCDTSSKRYRAVKRR